MKALVFMIIALFSNLTLANDWKEIVHNREGYTVRLSYTSDWLPATYGSHGGSIAGIFYVDVYGKNAMNATEVEITEENTGNLISRFSFSQDHSKHFYAKMPRGSSYGDKIWFKKNYNFKVIVDGRVIEGKFRL